MIDEAIKNKVNLIVSHHPIFTGSGKEEKPEIQVETEKSVEKICGFNFLLYLCIVNEKGIRFQSVLYND
mgnify:CR=1 FL=1